MAVTRRTSRRRFTLALLVLTSITLLTLDFRGFGPLESARSAALGLLAPVGEFFGRIGEPVGEMWRGARGYGELEAENQRLKGRIDELEGRLATSEAAQQELDELKRALNIEFAGGIEKVTARVSSGPVSNYDATIQIDKGASSGIRPKMAVVTGAGLLGHVDVVSENRATVRLVTEKDQSVGVKVRSDQPVKGVARGQGNEHTLRATLIRFEDPVAVDDLILTSGGRGSFYPPDIPVGKVTAVYEDEPSRQKEIEIDLFVNVGDVEYVQVLLQEPPE
ncbi:MAG: rod shape-determining protein MreC [Acidimicrobiales bacterium]|nr:rod shape-determining protein MreC [Acidimicrobiales bacterium]